MSHLSIYLFGGFRAELDGQLLTSFGTDKNRALLAYLALESGRPHRREALASLLWPDHRDVVARNSLRQALYQLRQILMHEADTEPHLLITREQVRFNPASDHWIDVVEFMSQLSACQSHHPAGLKLCAGCLEGLQRAVQLYQGEILEGFTLPRCTQFSEWQIINQENSHRQVLAALSLLSGYYENNLAFEQLIACTRRKIELEPWRESAYQRQMWALAMSGQRERALRQYKSLCEILQRELGVLPLEATMRIYDQIRAGNLPGPTSFTHKLRRSFPRSGQLPVIEVPPFVGRQAELAKLQRYLEESSTGTGRVIFLSGEAGSGKTTLMNEFACLATSIHNDLLVASGACSARYGLGAPYHPFREVLETLDGMISSTHPGTLGPSFWEQTDLFDQVTARILRLSRRFPLLILIDDMQWADCSTVSLLFHLGCHLSGTRILLLGAFRPEDIVFGANGDRHPLAAILNEFQRRNGENQVDLSHTDGRAFVQAYLDSQPNTFGQEFRETFYRHTGGNALFTVELLRGMQARGEAVQDASGDWGEGAEVDWMQIPARVEAVIVERLDRLDEECHSLLEAASVQGEVFIARVLAHVLGVTEDVITTHLSGPLCKQHRLVDSLGLVWQNGSYQARYRFRNLLFQKYLFRGLDEVERARLQRATAEALSEWASTNGALRTKPRIHE